MPAEMGAAAHAIGMTATMHMVGLVIPWVVNHLYPGAQANCALAVPPIPVVKQSIMPLLRGQRQLCIVEIGLTGLLHWVLMRPTWTYMDPADGVDRWAWIALGQGPFRLQKYIYTGISLVVE